MGSGFPYGSLVIAVRILGVMASRTLQFGEHFFNYVAPEEDSHWSENVFTSCTDNGDQEDVTKDMHKDFFCENCHKQFLTKTLLRLHKKTHVV